MLVRVRLTLWLLLVLGFAVPALLTDLECMVGPSDCCACQDDAVADDCSAASLAASGVPTPAEPPQDVAFVLPLPVAPSPLALAEPCDERAPREGPPLCAVGLRAPPA